MLNRRKLWFAWFVTFLQAVIFYLVGIPDAAWATMGACVVLGWLAAATRAS